MTIQNHAFTVDRRHDRGSFDIIGDVHGCFDELVDLLTKLGYEINGSEQIYVSHPYGRRLIFVGDLVDRGTNSPDVLRLVMNSVFHGTAFCVCGNHDDKLKRKLMGRPVTISHGLEETLSQLDQESDTFKSSVLAFLKRLPPYVIFDYGKIAVVHAGIKEDDLGKISARILAFCLYGQTMGKIDESGFPVRDAWAQEYKGQTLIVYGHTTVEESTWINNTINIDTGCVFGGKLSALQYPEKTIVSVSAAKTYWPRV